jgi:hypothetical protein
MDKIIPEPENRVIYSPFTWAEDGEEYTLLPTTAGLRLKRGDNSSDWEDVGEVKLASLLKDNGTLR